MSTCCAKVTKNQIELYTDRVPYFSYLTKAPFYYHTTNIATLFGLTHPVPISVTDLTSLNKLTNDLLILSIKQGSFMLGTLHRGSNSMPSQKGVRTLSIKYSSSCYNSHTVWLNKYLKIISLILLKVRYTKFCVCVSNNLY